MSSLTNVITAEQLRANQDSVFADVLTSAQPKVVIFDGEPSIMLVSASDYKAQMNRLAIIEKIIAGRTDIEAGRVVSNDQVIAELQQKIIETQKAIADGEG